MVKPILSRFFAALVSISMLMLGAPPAFAAMNCCPPAKMAMSMADMAQDGTTADHQKNMPCKMPAGSCASICAAMASVALIGPEIVRPVDAISVQPMWGVRTLSGGLSPPPALPPPITLA
jgi:hypothetical protein